MNNTKIDIGKVNKLILIISMIMVFVYFSWWLIPSHVGNKYFYDLLFIGEIYHVVMVLTFIHTVWPGAKKNRQLKPYDPQYKPSVDIYIPVVNEPWSVIYKTAKAAVDIKYPHCKVYILNDGYVAGNPRWQEPEKIARDLGITCITRRKPGGAKAGNINHALNETSGELIAIFDADMIPYPEFLKKTVPYFSGKDIGFVQTPQYYKNYWQNEITAGAWEQQRFFFGPILKGKERVNASFICGTNVVIRRKALMDVGGMYDKSITEDFLTSIFIHQKGWRSYYIPEILSEGLAPQDLLSYYKQQSRWAKGTLEVIFVQNPLFKSGLSIGQKIQYLTSALFYLNGLVVLIDIIMPLLFFYFGIQVVSGSTTSFAVFFIPYMALNLYCPFVASNNNMTFRALSFSHSSWFLQLSALKSVLLGEKSQFTVTPKQAQQGNFLYLVYPHLFYIIAGVVGSIIAIGRGGLTPSVATNIAWTFFNISMFLPFIKASYQWETVFNLNPKSALKKL